MQVRLYYIYYSYNFCAPIFNVHLKVHAPKGTTIRGMHHKNNLKNLLVSWMFLKNPYNIHTPTALLKAAAASAQ